MSGDPAGSVSREKDPLPGELRSLLSRWSTNARRGQHANYAAANFFNSIHHWLGIPTVILTVTAGAAVSSGEAGSGGWQAAAGLASFVAAILAGLATFLGCADRAAKHRACAVAYGSVKRRIDLLLAVPPDDPSSAKAAVDELQQRMADLAEAAPTIPKKLWARVLRSVPPAAP